MQPFMAAEKVKDAYWRYIETSFPIRNDALRQQFRRLVREEKLLWQEPFISLARPFKSGGTFDDLIAAGVLDPRIRTAYWGFSDLWEHQAAAVRPVRASASAAGRYQRQLRPLHRRYPQRRPRRPGQGHPPPRRFPGRGALHPARDSEDLAAERTLREAREAYATIPAAAQAFLDDLCQRDPRFQKGGRIRLASGESLDALALDPERGVAVILVDPDRWVFDPSTWRRSLAQHNRARLQGWRLIRVPRPWLSSMQGRELVDHLSKY